MNCFVLLSAILAAAVAKPIDQLVVVNQDTLGNYQLKYVIDGISRAENRDINGNVVGGYSYIDPQGILRKIEFTSGIHGFNAAGGDIPVPVPDTPEVAHAKAAHLEVLHAAELSLPPQPLEVRHPELFEKIEAPLVKSLPFAIAPAVHPIVHQGAIPETPEVIAARAAHLAVHAAHAAQHARLVLH